MKSPAVLGRPVMRWTERNLESGSRWMLRWMLWMLWVFSTVLFLVVIREVYAEDAAAATTGSLYWFKTSWFSFILDVVL